MDELLDKLIEKTGEITPETIKAGKLKGYALAKSIEETGEIGKYLTPEIIEAGDLKGYTLVKLIRKTGEIGKYLTPEIIKAGKLKGYTLVKLIEETGEIGKYLTLGIIIAGKLKKFDLRDLIEETGEIGKYLTPEIIIAGRLKGYYILVELIRKTGEIGKYLTPEIIKAGELEGENLAVLIKETGEMGKYLTPEKVKVLGMKGKEISICILGTEELGSLIDREIKEGTYSYDKVKRISEIFKEFQDSNSAKISRLAIEFATQIYALPEENQHTKIEEIKNIYLTTNLPTFAQNFLVFKELHPNFMDEDNNALYSDRSVGNIPSLTIASKTERNRIIFSDLLRITVESNSRELRDYIYTIEKGDQLFNMFKEGQLSIDDLPERERDILKRYSDILNALYNQTSQGKRQEKFRVNSGDIEQDLKQLDSLFSNNSNIHTNLPDRIVRMFGYWAGIRDFNQLKNMIEEIPKQADKRNRERQDFTVKQGDFVKGIKRTEFFPSMLQNGIIAKDYLGGDATSNGTPLDMDAEYIVYDGKIIIANGFTNKSISGIKLGKVIVVIADTDFVRTRDEYDEVDSVAVETVMKDRTKKECFTNGGGGYGIRTGLGSTNISYIIADRYVDKLGLEIALNGFYIPIVDEKGQVLYTPEMYDEYRSKMQGMSYYGVSEFQLDETAKNDGTRQLVEIIEQNKSEVSQKRQKILQALKIAIESTGLEMSDKRILDLSEGIVEVVDTGSTGRGTNEPGDEDFDFMIRIDKKLIKNPEKIKKAIKKALYAKEEPEESVTTGDGDFRFKGVTIEGLQDKVDIDLSFASRADELEYTTEECITDRLETIKRNNPENYQYVVANILLAKKVLKTEGAYKKKDAPAPEQGKKDTRGGLGAVGIENWILQNGGSFEKAAKDFLKVAHQCSSLEEFQQRYAIWDFGENYKAGDEYPHNNFVYNMNAEGYSKMVKALEDYIHALEEEKENSEQQRESRSLEDIVGEDMTVLGDTTYMLAVNGLLEKAKARTQEQGTQVQQ